MADKINAWLVRFVFAFAVYPAQEGQLSDCRIQLLLQSSLHGSTQPASMHVMHTSILACIAYV